MSRPLRVLIAEDNSTDAELIVRELRRAGFDPEWLRVETEAEFASQLAPDLDVILSDYSMPTFSGLRALEILRECGLEIPFILISGTIGEDTAVEAMKHGATDYLLKDRLARLGPAVTMALDQWRLRKEGKQAEEAMRQSEHKYRHLFESLSEAAFLIECSSRRIVDSNLCAEDLLGRTRAEILGMEERSLFPSEAATASGPVLTSVGATARRSQWEEAAVVTKDGRRIPVQISVAPVALYGRKLVLALMTDISERKRAEERLREQAAMLDRAHDAIIVRDFHDRRITYWNKGAESLYGWTAAEALGSDIGKLIFADPSKLKGIDGQLVQTDEWRGESRHVSKDGKELRMSTHATLMRDANGTPKSVLSINADVTEQKNLEARFLRAQRMESIGTLASGLAHDLNNILSPIMMSVPFLRRDLESEVREGIISTIELSAERGAQIVKQVLTFGRGLDGDRHPLQVDTFITELMKIMHETFPKNLVVESSLEPNLWPVLGDATQIHQVLLNLCVNARDAMPDGGSLQVRAVKRELNACDASMLLDATPGPHVLLEVSDTGSGIPLEILDRIFDPFFTTKSIGSGTGLGLSTVLGIVKSHGGFVHVNTEPGKGSTFQVYLPASPGSDAPDAEPRGTLLPKGQGELVLVVDDEPTVRDTTRIVLEAAGYRVLLASEGTEALTLFAMNSANIAVVLTDLMMPLMDGVALIRALRALAPKLPIIASSGLGEKAQVADLKSLNVETILQKPYGAEALQRVIREVLLPATKEAAV